MEPVYSLLLHSHCFVSLAAEGAEPIAVEGAEPFAVEGVGHMTETDKEQVGAVGNDN